MKFLVVFGLLALAAVSQGYEAINFPENFKDGSRIIGGAPAAKNAFPHQVYLRIQTSTGSTAACGGSLISPRWVLTAAHCLIRRAKAIVSIGAQSVNFPELVIESTDFVYHPQYNEQNLNNDLGLINLGRDLVVSDSIKPIRLLRKSQVGETQENVVATASGYGFTSNTGPVSEILNFVSLKVISQQECARIYGTAVVVASTICATGVGPNQATCSGDSGGPLIITESDGQISQVGVVSFGSAEGCTRYPSGFVRPVYFLDWINQVTGIAIRP